MKKEKIVIRSLSKKDRNRPEFFLAYINSLIRDPEIKVSFDKEKTREEEVRWLSNMISLVFASKAVVLIAESKGSIVGEISIALCLERRQHVAELGISILNGYRNCGLGSRLMKRALKAARRLNPQPKLIRLSTFGNNQMAKAFYQKHGFKMVASIPGQFEFNGQTIDEIVMIKNLKEVRI